MLCLVHNLAAECTRALRLSVWRYRFHLVADNLNSRGARIGAFHGAALPHPLICRAWSVLTRMHVA